MRVFITKTIIVSLFAVILVLSGCGPSKKVETEPQVITPPKEPTIEELRKPVAKDMMIYKAEAVIKEYGRFFKKYISYEKYDQLTGGQEGAAFDPDWFYDSYKMDMNEKDYWITVTYGTAERAIDKDPRIQKLMTALPEKSILIELQVPSGKKYLLSDANADGILDFAKDAKNKEQTKVDIALLDQMQEKYTWILGLIKKHYSKIKK